MFRSSFESVPEQLVSVPEQLVSVPGQLLETFRNATLTVTVTVRGARRL